MARRRRTAQRLEGAYGSFLVLVRRRRRDGLYTSRPRSSNHSPAILHLERRFSPGKIDEVSNSEPDPLNRCCVVLSLSSVTPCTRPSHPVPVPPHIFRCTLTCTLYPIHFHSHSSQSRSTRSRELAMCDLSISIPLRGLRSRPGGDGGGAFGVGVLVLDSWADMPYMT